MERLVKISEVRDVSIKRSLPLYFLSLPVVFLSMVYTIKLLNISGVFELHKEQSYKEFIYILTLFFYGYFTWNLPFWYYVKTSYLDGRFKKTRTYFSKRRAEDERESLIRDILNRRNTIPNIQTYTDTQSTIPCPVRLEIIRSFSLSLAATSILILIALLVEHPVTIIGLLTTATLFKLLARRRWSNRKLSIFHLASSLSVAQVLGTATGDRDYQLLFWVLIFLHLSFWIFDYWSRMAAVSAIRRCKNDIRPPVLYLRSFSHDGISFGTAHFSNEHEVSDVFSHFGPVIMLGKPGSIVKFGSPAPLLVNHGEWQNIVESLLSESCLVVLRPGATDGLLWEIERVFEKIEPNRILIIGCRPLAQITEEVIESTWRCISRIVSRQSSKSFCFDITAQRKTPFLYTFDTDWNIREVRFSDLNLVQRIRLWHNRPDILASLISKFAFVGNDTFLIRPRISHNEWFCIAAIAIFLALFIFDKLS